MSDPRPGYEESLRHVREFVSAEHGIELSKLTPESRLFELGIDGDDAWELMARFWKQFNVAPGRFCFDLYFGPEQGPDLSNLADFVLAVFIGSRKVPLTVSDLAHAVERGTWENPAVPPVHQGGLLSAVRRWRSESRGRGDAP